MIRPLNPETDFAEWLRMRLLLWDDSTAEEHAAEMRELLAQETFAVFVAERPDGNGLAGFLEVGQRLYGEGCDTSPIAYMEGWFVEESARRQGIGRGLFAAGEAWHTNAATAKSAPTHGSTTILATMPTSPSATKKWNG